MIAYNNAASASDKKHSSFQLSLAVMARKRHNRYQMKFVINTS